MPKRFYKHKLLLDEHMQPRKSFPKLNSFFDLKHINHDLKQGGLNDDVIYKLAVE